jgi:hypothetical protein
LQKNGSVLFILCGSRHFQVLCVEATVLVRPARGKQALDTWLTDSDAVRQLSFDLSAKEKPWPAGEGGICMPSRPEEAILISPRLLRRKIRFL